MKTIKLTITAVVCGVLSACSNTVQFQSELVKSVYTCPPYSQAKDAGTEADAAVKSCEAERASGKLETYVDAAKCANPQIIKAFRSINYPYMDSVKTYTADHLDIAGRMDNKEITQDQMRSLLKESVENFKNNVKEAASIKVYPLSRKDAVASAECVTESGRPIWVKYAPSFVDLYDAFREEIEKNAKAYAKGSISFKKYIANLKQEQANFDNQVRSRRASVDAYNRQRLGFALLALSGAMQAGSDGLQQQQSYQPVQQQPYQQQQIQQQQQYQQQVPQSRVQEKLWSHQATSPPPQYPTDVYDGGLNQ